MRFGLPYSIGLFGFTAFIAALQLIPVLGVGLMMFAAPYWPIVTINLAFAAMAFESLVGVLPRACILAPLAWIGGYEAYAWKAHAEFAKLQEQFASDNAGKRVAFAPASTALVIKSDPNVLSGAAEAFVRSYDISSVFEPNPNFPPFTHLEHRIGGARVCQKIKADEDLRARGIDSFGFHEDRKFIDGMCQYHIPADPSARRLVVSASKQASVTSPGFSYRHGVVSFIDADGRTTELRTGFGASLDWLPKPIVGCGLSSNTGYECFAQWGKGEYQGLEGPGGGYGESTFRTIAGALGLRIAPASERRREIDARALADVAELEVARFKLPTKR